MEEYYSKSKLVVAPLRYGAGVKGKVVDTLYNGLPLVTTSIGAEGIQKAEEVMKIADDAEKFANEVIDLYTNEEKLEVMSEKALLNCKDNFSMQYAKQQMQSVLKDMN